MTRLTLTPAQIEALIDLPSDGDWKDASPPEQHPENVQWLALVATGLIELTCLPTPSYPDRTVILARLASAGQAKRELLGGGDGQ